MADFWSLITGNGEAAGAQAQNVARQWQTLLENAADMPDENYQSYYKTMVDAYGPPPAEYQAALDAERQSYHARATGTLGDPAELGSPVPDFTKLLRETAADSYNEIYGEAAKTGFVEGVKSVPGAVSGGLADAAGALIGGLPPWVKWTAAAALALYAIKLLAGLKK
jgi:hypothetical protein